MILQTTFPTSSRTTNLAAVKTIAAGATFDGGMKQWDRSPSACNDQVEGGDSDAVSLLQDGAVLSNVIVGPNNGEDSVHCLGTCALNNVWRTDVCEGAATFKQTSGKSYVNGRGVRGSDDKVLQHNGGGTVVVKNFFAQYSTSSNIRVDRASVAVGINGNEGDNTTISNSYILDSAICWIYKGNDGGSEPKKLASAPDGKACVINPVKASVC
ncbi:polysaccharide lyase family 3 protein [Glonium stellatum]|uniref:Pectate lyase n=1 Tax=Glonium stellatum TaxID=574774 RepID=A0A8E2JUN2_9PEZI|nr:polysaccharide lyase family 3 protein [Glonium stellatum]